jgi:NAD(P)-dependent dehydrogenase (short-subunit alcohol dehydrogenase family)
MSVLPEMCEEFETWHGLQARLPSSRVAAGALERATAERFAEEGAKVVVADIDTSGRRGRGPIRTDEGFSCGGDGHFSALRCHRPHKRREAIAETVARYGKLDILHNNAGGSTLQDGPVTDAPEEEFWRVIKLDLYGTFLCSKLAIPEIIKTGAVA